MFCFVVFSSHLLLNTLISLVIFFFDLLGFFFLNFGFIDLFIDLFSYDCVGSSFLCEGFL